LLLLTLTPAAYSAGMSEGSESQLEPSQPEGISLDELSEAFARAMGGRAEAPPAEDVQPAEKVQPAEDGRAVEDADAVEESDEIDACGISPRSILEAMLFVGDPKNLPLTGPTAAAVMRDVEPEEIVALTAELNERYRENGCPYEVVSEGAGFRLKLRRSFDNLLEKFHGRIREAKLSQAAIDVIAVVAYQQGISAERVAQLRGRPSGHVLGQLVRRQLLRIERTEDKSRSARYFTTARFLQLFALTGLEDMPQCEELPQPTTS